MKNSLILITPFPPKGTRYENKYSALASFAKNTVEALQKIKAKKILILGDIFPGSRAWKEKDIEVRRVWKRGSFSSYFKLAQEILKENSTVNILIELEWNLFGKNPLYLAPFPLFLIFLLILGKKVYIVMHGVSLNFKDLAPQLGLSPHGFKARVLSLGLNLFYFSLIKTAHKVIVLEALFAEKLNKKYKTNKVVFIPHGVDTDFKIPNKRQARNKLGLSQSDFLLVNFGFLTWYKGSDILAKLFSKTSPKNSKLIFAGGESLNHKKNNAYRKFVDGIVKTVSQNDNMTITGFLSEKEIPLYFAAADLIVFPYRLFISSSGPLSLAFSFKKPVILSSRLQGYLASPDFKASLDNAGLTKKDLFFRLEEKDFKQKIKLAQNKTKLKKLANFSSLVNKERCWLEVAKKYETIF